MSMTKAEVRELQRDLNHFTGRSLTKVAPLIVDGDRGFATNRRIMTCKWYLGYEGPQQRNARLTPAFRRRLDHPRDERFAPRDLRKRGHERRQHQREVAKRPIGPGVGKFDGRPCALWLIPYLEWARKNGWKGTLTSGWRDPEHSEDLCFIICGAPSCSGTCAGKSSNHVGSKRPQGAVDVTDYVRFGELMRNAPFDVRIFNALAPRDPVHFSASGR